MARKCLLQFSDMILSVIRSAVHLLADMNKFDVILTVHRR